MVKNRTRYSNEFKEKTARFIHKQNKSMPALAEELNLPVKLLHDWKAKYRSIIEESTGSFISPYVPDQEVTDLREQVKEMTEEIAILKKAMHIFSKDPK